MHQLIKKFFSLRQGQGDKKKKKDPSTGTFDKLSASSGFKKGKSVWAEKQLKEMGKLGGKLILM
jgi:hypothetical protein